VHDKYVECIVRFEFIVASMGDWPALPFRVIGQSLMLDRAVRWLRTDDLL